MDFLRDLESCDRGTRSHSAQGLANNVTSSPVMKIPLPPRLWITDVSDEESSEEIESCVRDEGVFNPERTRVKSRFRHYKQRSNVTVPLGIFWDIENCQVPRGCSAIDVVAAIRAKFLTGRREADFVVVCDVRKELPLRLQELNDAQVSLIHVCGTQKNAADEKLRQCMRRFGELHSAPASLLLISGDINFAADLSDFRHRKNMEVILVHKQNTSSALITCASSHYCYNELTAHLPRNPKTLSQTEEEEDPICEVEVRNLPLEQPPDRVSRRLRRLADNCGGRVLRVDTSTAVLRFPTPDHAARALKRMDGEDVFGRKITTRYLRPLQPYHAYSSDEGYSTAGVDNPAFIPPPVQASPVPLAPPTEWARALQTLPAPTPPPLDFCPPPAPRPRKIRGMHGSAPLDRSGCSSSNSGDDSRARDSQSRAASPWNSSASFSEPGSEAEDSTAELTVTNLPPFDPAVIQAMLTKLFSQYVPVVKVTVWVYNDGPIAIVVVRSEWDARLAIARVHKRRLDNAWGGRRLELALGRPSPAPNQDVLRARLRAILLDHPNHALPLLRLRDNYASRHCCALTTSDIARLKDTVVIHEGYGRLVQLTDLTPVTELDMEEAPWKCHIHDGLSTGHEDGSRILQPVFMEISVLAKNTLALLDSHGGKLPLLSFVECYEAAFSSFSYDATRGVPLELLLHGAAGVELRDAPSRHLVRKELQHDLSSSSRSSGERERPRTAPALEPMLALFERELVDLLRAAPRCCIPFSKLIPSFHHHFGRQCRVADYGFTKLPELLSALSSTIVVLGSGSYRIITISAAAQGRRWTADLLKLLKAVPGRAVYPNDIPALYQENFGKPFSPAEYGVCTLAELMRRVSAGTVATAADGAVSLPRRAPTPEERARAAQFALQAVELLCYTPNLRMEFSRFVPAYHAHFGSQLRVALYGCVKLVDLFDIIPDAVSVYTEPSGERGVRLAIRTARALLATRFRALGPVTLETLPQAYAAQFGAPPQPDVLNASTLEELVYATGGCVENGLVRAPGDAPLWVTSCLATCAVLSADRSVARGSTEEYFSSAFRKLRGCDPDVRRLALAGVILADARCVQLTPAWRVVWRVAQILADRPEPMPAMDVFGEYTSRFEPLFPCADLGFESVVDFLRHYREVFVEAGARWALSAGVAAPRCLGSQRHEDYSVHDTPPGQKGSRVFESPKTSLWCSPPASALPAPTALLVHESKRRIRLAAQFDAMQ